MTIKTNNLIDQTLQSLSDTTNSKKDCSVFGLSFGQKAMFVAKQSRQTVFVTQNMFEANKLQKQLESFGKKVQVLFSKQDDLVLSSKQTGQNIIENIKSLAHICTKKVDCIIVSPEFLLQKLPTKRIFKDSLILLKKGSTVSQKDLTKKLLQLGYQKVERVSRAGEFCVRGDIFDIFNFVDQVPTRIDFFDDEIESICTFSLENFKKNDEIKNITIVPTTYCVYVDNKSQLFNKVSANFDSTLTKLGTSEQQILKSNFEEFKINFEYDNLSYIQNWLYPFLDDINIFDYIEKDAIVMFDDVKIIYDKVNSYFDEFEATFKSLLSSGSILLQHQNYNFAKSKIFEIANQKISFQKITTANRIFQPQEVLSFKASAVTNYLGNYNLLVEDVNYYLEFKHTVIIYAGNASRAESLQKHFALHNINAVLSDSDTCQIGLVNITSKYLPYGAIFVEDKLVVVGTDELIKKESTKKIEVKSTKDEFTLPKIGDYVVHESFGVGLCVGIQKLKFTDYEKDYIILQYDGNDKLYLPTEQLGLISAYVSDGKSPKLNKLGTKDFEKTKQKVKASLKELAFDLIKLYSDREHTKGFAFEIDDKMFAELENSFGYEETEDQLSAIEDIKNDMSSNKIMDRLVCGDVGYGKTEVAIRASFISAMNSKQTAFLAPTTILSQQHYNTAKERLSKFGITVECLNRFKTKKQQQEIVSKLKNGEIDVICGTHRLLSKDVEFKDLGLLVLDEEQRFGVGDKEKIKNLKTNVDVLTLSATPIPRTLHMGLVGIRDISIIATAPTGRQPVQTTVTEFSDGLLIQAINREFSRNGQMLIIFNSVEKIYDFVAHVRKLVGNDVKIGIAHGQMAEKELEDAIMRLYSGETQILVSTTLIENGVDLPNANTLVIIDADKLGLSQLYQLKGRVGRSKNLGYAYFTFDKQKALSEEAYQRLNAITEFSELGSGFKIAMRDLEIRGCGNILGAEQSGHMAKVGYDMYCKILSEAVKELKGREVKQYKDIKLDVATNCFIPENYIQESDERFNVYNKLKQISTEVNRAKTLENIEKVFGKVPSELENLSYVALLRNLAREFDVKRISIDRERCLAEFYGKQEMLADAISKSLKENNVKVYFSSTGAIMNFMLSEYSVKKKLSVLCDIFEKAFVFSKRKTTD